MDVTSLLYFSIATTVTFIFNLSVFVEKSGFLGYSALFIMALFSLIIKQPYTLQVSKRDYPEIYWKDNSFLVINNIITAVWAVIFMANATVFLLLDIPFTVILSNTLIAFGIAFSIVFPLKAPAYFASKEFKKYDWTVEVTQKPKGENEYNVIIVGSGIGGLTCGALLSKRGYKILVLEQHYQIGGFCSSFKRKNFVFNIGVENVSGLWEKGPITYLLKELGLEKDKLFAKNRIRYIFKGKIIDANSLEDFIKVLSDMFPEERENIYTFFEEAKKAYEECYKDSEAYGVPLPAELIVKVFGAKKLLDYPKEHPYFYDWMNKTFKQKLNDYFTNGDLKTLLCALLGYLGTEPEKTQASSALTAVVSYYLHGGYFPRGGAQNFANALRDVIESYGGKVLTGHRVDKILVENGEVKGVKVGNKVFKSSIVVANANAKTTFLELVGEENLDKKFVKYIKSLKMSPSCFMLFLGVNMDLSGYSTIIENLDDSCSIVINSNADPSLAPKGKTSVTILISANYHDFAERGTKEYLQKKKELAEMLIKKAEKVIPDLSKRIIVQDAATPKTFERYTSMPKGAIYAFDQSIDTKRPYFKTPIRGLYLANASTFPGGGIEAVVISGIICANDICSWRPKHYERPLTLLR
ncbi:MAG: FAD-dependent oxidoreductase [Candidatus Odinarchaeia archaeon]